MPRRLMLPTPISRSLAMPTLSGCGFRPWVTPSSWLSCDRFVCMSPPELTAKANPEFAASIQSGGSRFREMIRHQEQNMRAAAQEKERQTEVGLMP